MIIGRKGFIVHDVFSVINDDNEGVVGIPLEEFNVELFDPNGLDALPTHPVTFSEMGNGHYRITFIPLLEGLYTIIVRHSTYFPAGKGGNFEIFNEDFSSLGIMVELVKDFNEGRWRIDKNTNQMIFFKADNTTEIARFNLYDSAGNPAIENVFDRRKI